MPKLPDRRSTTERVECTLLVPAYNEAGGIRRCLGAIAASPLPPGAVWSEWVVLDDTSSDGTATEAEEWARRHPELPLRVDRSAARRGKAVALEAARQVLAARAAEGLDVVMVVADADTRTTPGALAALIEPFVADASLGVAWGLSVPEGRLFAVRLSPLPSLAWRPDLINEDRPLAEFVRRAGVSHRSVPDATTRVTPARGRRDFYIQTYRLVATDAAVKAALGPAPAPHRDGSHRLATALAVARVAARNPAALPAYLSARVIAVLIHRLHPATFGDRWAVSESTKAVPPR